MKYARLSTEKYLVEAMEQEVAQIRKDKNREAVQSFFGMALYLSVFAIAFYSWFQFPQWYAMIENWIQTF